MYLLLEIAKDWQSAPEGNLAGTALVGSYRYNSYSGMTHDMIRNRVYVYWVSWCSQSGLFHIGRHAPAPITSGQRGEWRAEAARREAAAAGGGCSSSSKAVAVADPALSLLPVPPLAAVDLPQSVPGTARREMVRHFEVLRTLFPLTCTYTLHILPNSTV